ncbi:hypothetical protein ACHAP8_008654 [Fusarium lateritium]
MDLPFTISAGPNTDIWRKPPSEILENAPLHGSTTVSLPKFISASVTFSAKYTCRFDQVGLAVILRHPASPSTKWIKLGIEYFDEEPRPSVSCCDNWADWCAASLPASMVAAVTEGSQSVTFSLEKNEGALWVFFHDLNGRKFALREITWVYGLDDLDNWEAEIGAMAARPNTEAKSELNATFQAFDVSVE